MTARKARPGGPAEGWKISPEAIATQESEDKARAIQSVQSLLTEFRDTANNSFADPSAELIVLREEFNAIIRTNLTDDFQSVFRHFTTKHLIAYFYWFGLDAANAAMRAVEEANWPHAFLMINSANMHLRGMIDAPYRETLLKQRKLQPFTKMPGHNRGKLKTKTMLYHALKAEFPEKGATYLAKFIADNAAGQRHDIGECFVSVSENTSSGKFGVRLTDKATGEPTTVELIAQQIKKALSRASH